MKQWWKRRWRAVYTVEASFLVPLMLFTMAYAMRLGIAMHEEILEQAETECLADMWEVEDFYKFQLVREVLDDKS